MDKKEEVKIGEMRVTDNEKVLLVRALGSCIAVAVYDEDNEVGGLAHVLLGKGNRKREGKDALYADQAIDTLVNQIQRLGGEKENLEAKIAGGAYMFSSNIENHIGKKNIKAVEKELKDYGIKISGKDVGGENARNVKFKVGSMAMKVESKI